MPVSLPQLNVRISIHALREEGDPDASLILGRVIAISIHALREEGDDLGPRDRRSPSNFYPRPPRGGRQVAMFRLIVVIEFLSTPSARRATSRPSLSRLRSTRFLSTPSARRATTGRLVDMSFSLFLSTPSARRATFPTSGTFAELHISIHALREEGDARNFAAWSTGNVFLSTPSARRATLLFDIPLLHHKISIHALREEGDCPDLRPSSAVRLFLSTPSARRATHLPGCLPPVHHISIHALREEGDVISYDLTYTDDISIHALREEGDPRSVIPLSAGMYFYPRPPRGGRPASAGRIHRAAGYFYPRPPRGGRQLVLCGGKEGFDFYPRPPRGGRQGVYICEACGTDISIHALREEGDRGCPDGPADYFYFYPRPPRGGRR